MHTEQWEAAEGQDVLLSVAIAKLTTDRPESHLCRPSDNHCHGRPATSLARPHAIEEGDKVALLNAPPSPPLGFSARL